MSKKDPGSREDESLRPLAGLTVIDLSQVLVGPLCTMILGDLGADVVKVEPPHGDQSRESLGTRSVTTAWPSWRSTATNAASYSICRRTPAAEPCTASWRTPTRGRELPSGGG
jgi:crotonobetainyl-CoA:carnitine CoA-transferase CaiB-like acyl-CoA transferase